MPCKCDLTWLTVQLDESKIIISKNMSQTLNLNFLNLFGTFIYILITLCINKMLFELFLTDKFLNNLENMIF